MNNLLINELYIFSLIEKKARKFIFSKGKNIITSNGLDGTKRGKSAVLKSIYHSLGADCYFEDIWQVDTKLFILKFQIDEECFFIHRYQRMFKIFSENFVLLYKANNRSDLAEIMQKLYKFGVKLLGEDKKMELAPPAYSYILNYIDQDKIDGTNFKSFKNLSQYSNFKRDLLYYHFSVLDEEYYKIIDKIEKLEDEEKELGKEKEILSKLIEKIEEANLETGYIKTLETLEIELERFREEYSVIVNSLNKIKLNLVNLRNEKYELVNNLNQLKDAQKVVEKDIKKLNKHLCPMCDSEIEDEMDIKLNKYNDIGDLEILTYDVETNIMNIDAKLKKEEEKYKRELQVLKKYEDKLKINSGKIEDILKYKGMVEVRENFLLDLGKVQKELISNNNTLKSLKNKKNKYDKKKKDVNNRYYELMVEDKEFFKLEEIDNKNLVRIDKVFTAGGSNRSIATIMWYFNLLRLRYEFNSNVIKFPLILDSPNNVESDYEKKHMLLNYLFNNIDENTQLIISTLDFKEEEYSDVKIDKIIELKNEKYSLLLKEEYEKNKEFLENFMKN